MLSPLKVARADGTGVALVQHACLPAEGAGSELKAGGTLSPESSGFECSGVDV